MRAAPRRRSRGRDEAPSRRAPRRCRLPAAWKSAESSARRSHSRCGAIVASSSRTSSDVITADALEREEPPLDLDSGRRRTRRCRARRRLDDTGRRTRTGSRRRTRPQLARRPGSTRERGELAVRHDLAARHRAQRLDERALKRRRPVEVERRRRRRHVLTLRERTEPARSSVVRAGVGHRPSDTG